MADPSTVPQPPGAEDVLERVIETGDLGEQIDRSILEGIPFPWLWWTLLSLAAAYVVVCVVRRIRLRVQRRRDPYELPGRAFARCMSEIQRQIRDLAAKKTLSAEEEGRWLKLYREAEASGSRYTRLVENYEAEIVERDIQYFGDMQTRFNEMVAAWKTLRDHMQDLKATMADTDHLANVRRRANDRVQKFLDAAKELENQCDRVIHQPHNLRRG